jgi:CBS domain containing-hemolysin-like protein
MITTTPILPILFLAGSCFIIAIKAATRSFKNAELEEEFERCRIQYFFFRALKKLFPASRTHPLRDFLNLSGLITIVGYGICGTFYIFTSGLYRDLTLSHTSLPSLGTLSFTIAILVLIALITNLLFQIFALCAEVATLKLFSLLTSLYLIILFPLVWPILWVEKKIGVNQKNPEPKLSSEKLKKGLLHLVKELEIEELLEPRDKKMMKAIAHFGDLVAREIMVPRVHMLCVPEEATALEALKLFIEEGYSRIPVYKDSVDHISGILLYKDMIKFFLYALETGIDELKKTTIQTLMNPTIYTPENRKIRDLFQELRVQKMHVAIVVNEYGCTEGLVTIEDVLEELVGSEIQDEHDVDEELLYKETHDKSWIVDAKMSIVDAEKQFGLILPHNAEYETIAGFISWKMGTIPPPGTTILEDQFNIKVLSSDPRQIHKIKITPEHRSGKE